MNKNAIETFEKVNELLNEETHDHPESVIKLYDRHQIWLATSSSVNTAAATKKSLLVYFESRNWSRQNSCRSNFKITC